MLLFSVIHIIKTQCVSVCLCVCVCVSAEIKKSIENLLVNVVYLIICGDYREANNSHKTE